MLKSFCIGWDTLFLKLNAISKGSALNMPISGMNTFLTTICAFYFLFFTFVVLVNMFSAVMLDSYSQFMLLLETDLKEEDFSSFYLVWKQFDQNESHFVDVGQLSSLFDNLESPLKVSKPNRCAIALMNIGICKSA